MRKERKMYKLMQGFNLVSIVHAKIGSATDHESYYLYRVFSTSPRHFVSNFSFQIVCMLGHSVNCLTAGQRYQKFHPSFISSLCLPSLLITQENIPKIKFFQEKIKFKSVAKKMQFIFLDKRKCHRIYNGNSCGVKQSVLILLKSDILYFSTQIG